MKAFDEQFRSTNLDIFGHIECRARLWDSIRRPNILLVLSSRPATACLCTLVRLFLDWLSNSSPGHCYNSRYRILVLREVSTSNCIGVSRESTSGTVMMCEAQEGVVYWQLSMFDRKLISIVLMMQEV